MTDTTPPPDRPPLWQVMRNAESSCASDYTSPEARVLRALQRKVLPDEPEVILPEYPDTIEAAAWGAWKARANLRARLLAEAQRAEEGTT